MPEYPTYVPAGMMEAKHGCVAELVTPTNKSWVFGDLLAHLQEEHATFTAAKETTQA